MARRQKCRIVSEHNTKATAIKHVRKIEKSGARAFYRKTRSKALPYKIYSCRG